VERDFVTDPGTVSGELAAELMQARLDRRALLANFDAELAEHAKPAPEMPVPASVEPAAALPAPERGTGVREAHGSAQAREEWQVRITAPDGTGIVQPADGPASAHAAAAKWRTDLADSEVLYCVEAERRLVGPWELAPSSEGGTDG